MGKLLGQTYMDLWNVGTHSRLEGLLLSYIKGTDIAFIMASWDAVETLLCLAYLHVYISKPRFFVEV